MTGLLLVFVLGCHQTLLQCLTLTTATFNSFDGHHFMTGATAILTPEPSTWVLLASGLVALVLWRWRHSIRLLVLIGLTLCPALGHATSITITAVRSGATFSASVVSGCPAIIPSSAEC